MRGSKVAPSRSCPHALTDRAIRNAKPADKPIRRFDGGGLYLEVAPSGGKWWRLKYRIGDKERRLSLGVYPDVALADARARRDAARKLLADGVDPSAQRKADKREAAGRAANSFEAVAREWYAKQAHTWVATHATDVLRRLESNLFPEIGATPIAELTAPELLAAVRKIEQRGARDLAHRVLQVSGQVLRYGIATGRCKRDLSADLKGALAPHKSKHQAAVMPDELPALLRAIDGYGALGDKLTGYALRLLALTFLRTAELIGARWAEIDLEAALWIIPAERMKMKTEHVVPLSRQSVEILRELHAIGGGSRYVFPGRNPDKPISNNTMLFALYRLGYKGRQTGHGFRSNAASTLNEAGFHADVIERQLAHCERNAVRGAYNRAEYLPERQKLMQSWADMLDAL
ncbi:MAG: tyrosine-type recombinase/integrase [Betaproteobacteria bacterium]|nr:tyrosine-type recombinase/integrase [Betaproteobacteria bacterium]